MSYALGVLLLKILAALQPRGRPQSPSGGRGGYPGDRETVEDVLRPAAAVDGGYGGGGG